MSEWLAQELREQGGICHTGRTTGTTCVHGGIGCAVDHISNYRKIVREQADLARELYEALRPIDNLPMAGKSLKELGSGDWELPLSPVRKALARYEREVSGE